MSHAASDETTVERLSRLEVDTRPLLQELLDAGETLGHYLAVAVDGGQARFFEVSALRTAELSGVIGRRRQGGRFRHDRSHPPGAGARALRRRLAEERRRHYAATAREVARLVRSHPFLGIVVLGPDPHPSRLVDALAPRVRTRVIGRASIDPGRATLAEVSRAAWLVQADRKRTEEAELLAAVAGGGADGWAVNGPVEPVANLVNWVRR